MSLSDAMIPAALTGVIAGVGSTYMMNSSMNQSISILGRDVSAPIAYGIVGGASKLANYYSRDSILPYFTSSGMMQGLIGVASPIITGVSMVVVAGIVEGRVPNSSSGVRLFVLGAASDAIGDYLGTYLNLI